MKLLSSAVLVIVTTLSASVAAQNRQIRPLAGHGHIRQAVDVSAATTDDRNWGVEYLNGEVFVSADGLSGANTAPHDVYVFDTAGVFRRQFTQAPHTNGSRLGWTDMATDGRSLICGSELGLHVIDVNGNLVNTVVAVNGPQTITQPIVGPALGPLTSFFGVAYDPNGNGGNGSVWVGDGSADLFEIDLAGNILTQHPNLDNWFVRGLVRDHVTGRLWMNSVPHRGFLAEVDPATGRTTGRTLKRGRMAFPGGLGAVRDGAFGSQFDLIEFTQTDDFYNIHRVHQYPNLLGWNEPVLLTDTASQSQPPTSFSQAIKPFRGGSLISFLIDASADPTLNGMPAAVFMNFGNDATRTGTTNLFFLPGNPVFPELVALNPLSVPVSSSFFLNLSAAIGTPVVIPVPAAIGVSNGDRVRLQAFYVHPRSPIFLLATNDQILEAYSSRIIIEVEGADSTLPSTEYGFFRVTHMSGSPIVELTVDFTTSSNPNHATTEFDTDSTSIGFRFDGGNSQIDECGGTYRNGSDVATGLLYDGQNTPSPCDLNADTGWIGTNAGNGVNDFRTLMFRFAPGMFDHQRFEFDVDTDQGPGVNGGAHAGMVVTIKLQDNTVLQGELVAHPTDPNRASLAF